MANLARPSGSEVKPQNCSEENRNETEGGLVLAGIKVKDTISCLRRHPQEELFWASLIVGVDDPLTITPAGGFRVKTRDEGGRRKSLQRGRSYSVSRKSLEYGKPKSKEFERGRVLGPGTLDPRSEDVPKTACTGVPRRKLKSFIYSLIYRKAAPHISPAAATDRVWPGRRGETGRLPNWANESDLLKITQRRGGA